MSAPPKADRHDDADRPPRTSAPLRLVFFGTPDVAVPTLEALIAGRHHVVGVVSQPDRERGRGRKTSPSPVSAVALREGIPLIRPEKVGDKETRAELEALAPDLGIVVAFGQFIPKSIRELPSRGYLINAHASLLPKYRGAAPIARVILDGEVETGISVMRIEREMDAGPVALVRRTKIGEDENTAELTERLSHLAATAISLAVDQISQNVIAWSDQDEKRATFAAKIVKEDRELDLREPATALVRRIHALGPKPGGTLVLCAGDTHTEIKISRARSVAFAPGERPEPGVLRPGAEDVPLGIATGDGWLIPSTVQKAGGKPLPIEDFLRGFEIADGARFLVNEGRANDPVENA